MNQSSQTSKELYFLSGGGEMGRLIRETDWSQTGLGDPKDWPPSLCTMVTVMLNNPFGMYIAWGHDYIQLYNDGYRPILGSTKHPQALGISSRVTFEEIWHIIGPMFAGVMEGKAVGFPDFILPLNRNGFVEECYFDFSYSPIIKEDGLVGGILVTVIETTEKKKAIDALKESEERFRNMADNIPNLAWMANADGYIYWYNKKWFEYTGTTLEDMLGWGWQSVHDPEILPTVMKEWQAAIIKQQPFEMVFPLKRADGVFKQFLTRVLPFYNSEGRVYQWFGTNTDISEQIKTQNALQKSEQNLRNTILQAPIAMCFLRGANHVVELANEPMFELWGKTSADVLNKPIFEGLPEAKDQGFEQLLDHVFTTGETYSAQQMPINLPRNEKIETIYVNFVYAPHRESDGFISGILAVAIDVTAQVLAHQKIEEVVTERTKELAEANHNLIKSNAELEQFAYIASHDLQEPLRKVSIFTQMLEHSLGDIDERSKNYLVKINSSSSRMLLLIRDVLAYSQLSKEALFFKTVNLKQVVDEIKNDFELLIEQKKATIHCEEMPTIEAIPLQMAQLFGNLISNGLKFSKEGVELVITITAKILTSKEVAKYLDPIMNTQYYMIECRDNGIGFNPEHAKQIFNIFQRLHGRDAYSGTGIGLAMCKRIAQNHKGDIFAESEQEKGATFKIILPEKQIEGDKRNYLEVR